MKGKARKAGKAESACATAAQVQHNFVKTENYFISSRMHLVGIPTDAETEAHITGAYNGKNSTSPNMYFSPFLVRHYIQNDRHERLVRNVPEYARCNKEAAEELRKLQGKQVALSEPSRRKATRVKEQLLAKGGNLTTDELCQLGRAHHDLHELDDANAAYKQALAASTTNDEKGRIANSLAQVSFDTRNPDEGYSWNQMAQEYLNPLTSPVYTPACTSTPSYARCSPGGLRA